MNPNTSIRPEAVTGPEPVAAGPARPRALERLRRVDVGTALAWLVVLVAVAWALAPGLFTSADPVTGIAADALRPPDAEYPFGTDATGRDVFTRVVYGSVHSLSGALIAVTVGLVAGTLIGAVAGAVGGLVEDVLMRVVDVLLAVPSLLLSLSVVIVLGFGTTQIAFAVGVAGVAAFARLARSEVVRVCATDYVEAAYAGGGRFLTVLWRHVLPNSLTAVAALAALQFGTAILAISTLGFLGYGAPPPTPEWGLMIAEGRDYVATSWWLTTLPGLVVVAVVSSANRISASIARWGRA
ncbi:ABC transporter permease [Nocardiopsis alba]|uniref:ABC transporter permease n=1 Tax=Nocardiopsis alba TaxID=53437 RepID=UPI003D7665AE